MKLQSNGWRAKAINDQHVARRARNKLIADLKRSRVYDEYGSADLLAIQRDLKADFAVRDAARRAA